MQRPYRQPRGYVLLLSLVLLSLVSLAMASAVRLSLSRSLESMNAEQQLQQQWALKSCRDTLLPRVEAILSKEEQRIKKPVPQLTKVILLSDQKLQLLLADEQSKANANTVFRSTSKQILERNVRQLISDRGAKLQVRLRPGQKLRERADPFESLAQVLDDPDPAELSGMSGLSVNRDALGLTCWGDGRINFKRASKAAITAGCSPPLSAGVASQLVALRDRDPKLSLSQALTQLQRSREEVVKLEQLLTESSTCHSLWIGAQTPGELKYELSIRDSNAGQEPRVYVFSW